MIILYCKQCDKPYGLRSKTIKDGFTEKAIKIRKEFKKMERCTCENKNGWRD